MSIPFPNPSNLSKTPPLAPLSSPTSVLTSIHHPLSTLARPLMLADLEQYRRSKERSLPTTSSQHESIIIPVPPPRGTERYCTWRCKSWKKFNPSEGVLQCECGFEHEIVHPREWKETPAEAEWDYGVKGGGWGLRQRKVRFEDPVVTDVVEMVGWRGRERDWEWVEKEDGEMGAVGEDPDEEMEDVFEDLDPDVYLWTDGCIGAGVLDPADTPCQ